MNTYSFMTKDGFRVDVKASNPSAGYNKLKDVPHLAEKLTQTYLKYGKDGFASLHQWQYLGVGEVWK